MAGYNRGEDYMASKEEDEVSNVGKKYGGLVPKKKPLISKDHERAFFDSADWALGKQAAGVGQKPKAAVETLRPKLQRTQHQQLPPRRPACTSSGNSLSCNNPMHNSGVKIMHSSARSQNQEVK
ncbi:Endosulphine [Macleaya cordata]|uniref:Endosulphine n=1 Tax=Macleaya cordata TaxID=56857 RepID=A0A200R261_MACCD|nr:Endosulphine [Macleaya cordata]